MAKWFLGILWAFACTAHTAEDELAARSGTLSVSSTVSGCTFTVDVAWSGFMGGNDTLEVFLSQVFPPINDGIILEPSVFVRPVKGRGGSVSVTLPAIAGSATTNSFRAGAQLLDNKGALISPSHHISDVIVAYCNGL
jgi:hypothetical protein